MKISGRFIEIHRIHRIHPTYIHHTYIRFDFKSKLQSRQFESKSQLSECSRYQNERILNISNMCTNWYRIFWSGFCMFLKLNDWNHVNAQIVYDKQYLAWLSNTYKQIDGWLSINHSVYLMTVRADEVKFNRCFFPAE